MSQDITIVWRQESPSLHAAYITTAQGRDLYVGYVATGPDTDVWRGYVGVGFIPVGMGPRDVMQRVVAQRAAEALNARVDGEEVAGHAS